MLWHSRHMLLIYYGLLPINVLSICCRCAFGFNLNFNRRCTMISIRYNSSLRHRNRNYQSLINGPTKWYQYAYQCRIIFYLIALASAGDMLSIIAFNIDCQFLIRPDPSDLTVWKDTVFSSPTINRKIGRKSGLSVHLSSRSIMWHYRIARENTMVHVEYLRELGFRWMFDVSSMFKVFS